MHLKDLILLNTALPDMFDGTLVNFRKMVQLSFIFTEVMQVQDGSLPFEVNMDLANTLRVSPLEGQHGPHKHTQSKSTARSAWTSQTHLE